MPFVLDASTALSLVLEDEKSIFVSAAEYTLSKLTEDSAIVPSIFWSEVGNALVVNERRGRLIREQMLDYFQQLKRLPIAISASSVNRFVLELACRHQLSVYDATYLGLALNEDVALATVDAKLVEAAYTENVEILQPMARI